MRLATIVLNLLFYSALLENYSNYSQLCDKLLFSVYASITERLNKPEELRKDLLVVDCIIIAVAVKTTQYVAV